MATLCLRTFAERESFVNGFLAFRFNIMISGKKFPYFSYDIISPDITSKTIYIYNIRIF